MPDEPVPEPVLRGPTPVRTFEWRGHPFELFDHPYNATLTNERAVEIPIAVDFIARAAGAGLEFGNVLQHYFDTDRIPARAIIDRYEEGPGVVNADIFEVGGKYDWIVSVSTLEHVRRDEHPDNPWGAAAAMLFLRGLLRPGGTMLVTVGMGQHREFDQFLLGTRTGEILVRERSDDTRVNRWENARVKYKGGPFEIEPAREHGCDAVWIGEWRG